MTAKYKISRDTLTCLAQTSRAGPFPAAVVVPPEGAQIAQHGSHCLARATMLMVAKNVAAATGAAICALHYNHTIGEDQHRDAVEAADFRALDAEKVIMAVTTRGSATWKDLGDFGYAANLAASIVQVALSLIGVYGPPHGPLKTYVDEGGHSVTKETAQEVPYVLLEPFRIATPINVKLCPQVESHAIIYAGHGVAIVGYDSLVYPCNVIVSAIQWHARHRGVPLNVAVLVDFTTGMFSPFAF